MPNAFPISNEMKYIFILGRNPGLSIAELYAKWPEAKFEFVSAEAVLASFSGSVDARVAMSELGGTIKIGEIIGECAPSELEDFIFSYLEETLAGNPAPEQVRYRARKIFFGLSYYGEGKINTNVLGKELKLRLKDANISSRHVISRKKNLSSVVVKTNKLLTRGAEFLLVPHTGKIVVGKTLAVQEFEEFSYRDFGRPAREMEVGLLPPKVARIMINLAKVDKTAAILDPFCGFGTIATEAMIMGYKNIYTSDLEASILDGTKKNIEWVKRFFPETASAETHIFQSPAEEISKHFKKREIDVIVTEPYLGPIQRSTLQEAEAKARLAELGKIYFESLRDWPKILKPGGRVVMIFPAFQTKTGTMSISVLQELKNLPYDILPALPTEATRLPYIKANPQGGLIYERPGQKVIREIFVLCLGA